MAIRVRMRMAIRVRMRDDEERSDE